MLIIKTHPILFLLFLELIFFQRINSHSEENSKIENVLSALKEVAYSYYLRGKYIQYNSNKKGFFSPEEATSQNIRHIVCSQFVFNIYKEVLDIGIEIPDTTNSHINYSQTYKEEPEVIAYSKKIDEKNITMFFKGNKTGVRNLSIKSIISKLQIGDLLTFQNFNGGGHTIMIYDIIKDKEGNVTDAYIIESTVGIGKAYINSKICNGIRGSSFTSSNHYLYFNKKNNTEIGEEGLEEGSIGIRSLLSDEKWKVMNNRSYAILRFIHNESNTAYIKYRNDSININEKVLLSAKNMDRKFNQ